MRTRSQTKWHVRAVAFLMLVMQAGAGLPMPLLAQSVGETPFEPAVPPPPAAPEPPPTNEAVQIRQPDTTLITPGLTFSSAPTDDELTAARVFREPLVPLAAVELPGENLALAGALLAYKGQANPIGFDAITAFVQAYPGSKWRASLEVEMGVLLREAGSFSKSLELLSSAWSRSKGGEGIEVRAMADRAFGEMADLCARAGRTDQLVAMFDEAGSRDFQGPGAVMVARSRAALRFMTSNPEKGFLCGPLAVNSILNRGSAAASLNGEVNAENSGEKGTSLLQLKDLSRRVGLNYQAVRKDSGSAWIAPAVVHWKIGHYGAILEKGEDGRYLVVDSALDVPTWVTTEVLAAEASGAFLVPSGPLPEGWSALDNEAAGQIWGKGSPALPNDDQKTVSNSYAGGDGNGGGSSMAGFSIFKMLGTLQVSLTPVKYITPIGPSVSFSLVYNYLENGQPANFDFTNTGVFWTNNWVSYLTVDSSKNITLAARGGGTETYPFTSFDKFSGLYAPNRFSRAGIKVVTNPDGTKTYQRLLPNGAMEVYSQPDGTGKIFLKSVVDPQGNAVTLTYDTSFRLTTITDASGLPTTISYTGTSKRITKITDPYQRETAFGYDAANNLTSVTANNNGSADTKIVSQFIYKESNFIGQMITPYGTTYFYQYVPAEDGTARGLWVVFPDGSKQALESYFGTTMMTYYWDKQAMATDPGARSAAYQTRWMSNTVDGQLRMEDVAKWTKSPLEGMVVYSYDGESTPTGVLYSTPDQMQTAPDGIPFLVGPSSQPNTITRNLDDGTLQTQSFSYNALGRVTQSIDPLGRTFSYFYAPNQMDLLEVRQTRGTNNDLLAKMTYNSAHQPLTITDASGRVTQNEYNAKGQLTSTTNDKNETVTYTMNGTAGSVTGYLGQIDGPLAGSNDITKFTYDTKGRVVTTTSYQGPNATDRYTLTTAYDDLDRVTSVTYPDATTETTSYFLLDQYKSKDRIGRETFYSYDVVGNLVATYDPLGRWTQYGYNPGGLLEKLTDPAGNVTRWEYDGQGRTRWKIFADNSRYESVYEPVTGRLKTTTDPNGTTTRYVYKIDESLERITFPTLGGNVTATSDISYTYDPDYPRVKTVSNDYGTYTYNYNPYVSDFYGAKGLGRGQLGSIENSAMGNSTISFTYDELGRALKRQINGTDNESSVTFDTAGRISSTVNPLGTFTPTYQNSDYGVARLQSVACSNGMTYSFNYEDATKDFRMKQMKATNSANGTISKFDYVTDVVGRITEWTKQADSATPTKETLGYNTGDELISAILKNTSTNAVLKTRQYAYDSAGNRKGERMDNDLRGATFNSLNQLTAAAPGGPTLIQGILDKPGKVTINGTPATMTSNGTAFSGNITLGIGTSRVSVTASTANNTASSTKNYDITVPSGPTRTLAYDANGNTQSEASNNTYAWDALNRLVKISYPDGKTSNFTYDALGRRVKIEERDASNAVTSTKNFLWNGTAIAEQRDENNNVKRQYFSQGYRDVAGNANYYYTTDHLGSVREVIAADGSTIAARYDYELYGKATKVSGTQDSDFLFTGYYYHAPSGLYLAPFRAYDAGLGRFISRDPIAEAGGMNLYGYCGNNPVCATDPLGLQVERPTAWVNLGASNDPDDWNSQWPSYANTNDIKAILAAYAWKFPWLKWSESSISFYGQGHRSGGDKGDKRGDGPGPVPGPAPTPVKKSPKAIRLAIVVHARDQIGSGAWNRDAFNFPLPSGAYKCNLFVADILAESGASPGNAPGRFTPYSAAEWADPKVTIPKWIVTSEPQVGDVISSGRHVGIVTGVGLTTSATANGVVENDYGFRGNQRCIIFRTYDNN